MKTPRPLTIACAALALAQSTLLMAQSTALAAPAPASRLPDGIDGLNADWDGALTVQAITLRLVFHVRASGGQITTATLDSLDQNAYSIPISEVSRTGDQVAFVVAEIQGRFEGTLSADGKVIHGRWQQLGNELPLTLTRRAA